jgi:hypothetical protein
VTPALAASRPPVARIEGSPLTLFRLETNLIEARHHHWSVANGPDPGLSVDLKMASLLDPSPPGVLDGWTRAPRHQRNVDSDPS